VGLLDAGADVVVPGKCAFRRSVVETDPGRYGRDQIDAARLSIRAGSDSDRYGSDRRLSAVVPDKYERFYR
jgi:hypothetical protein